MTCRLAEPVGHIFKPQYLGHPTAQTIVEEQRRSFPDVSRRFLRLGVGLGLKAPVAFAQVMQQGKDGQAVEVYFGQRMARLPLQIAANGGQAA